MKLLMQPKKQRGAGGGSGRLIFALDATASREPTWKLACLRLQAGMFNEVRSVGSLAVQLVYYRGLDECESSRWHTDHTKLSGLMESIGCVMGHTQIGRVLTHARHETQALLPLPNRLGGISALVFIGDACEENPDKLAKGAGELGRLNVPCFMFQEGECREVEAIFREIARLTHGAYGRFNAGAAQQLGALLRAVAVFAVGGLPALAAQKDAEAVKLLGQLR
jgi:hypothetical protein